MSELSEHDRAELHRIELELSTEDPGLARLLGDFGRHRLRRLRRLRRLVTGPWVYIDIVVLAVLALVPLLVGFAR